MTRYEKDMIYGFIDLWELLFGFEKLMTEFMESDEK